MNCLLTTKFSFCPAALKRTSARDTMGRTNE